MYEQQQDRSDTGPGRWVPVLDAVEAVMARIARESGQRQGQRPDSAEAAPA